MKTVLRIHASLRTAIDVDLMRPHRFAAERFGFAFAKWTSAGDAVVIIPNTYLLVEDDEYIQDDSVGAKINGNAIRRALQESLRLGATFLHVHAHPSSMPYFGELDLLELRKLLPSFRATVPRAPHGALLLYPGGAVARIWHTGANEPSAVEKVVVVGFPFQISESTHDR